MRRHVDTNGVSLLSVYRFSTLVILCPIFYLLPFLPEDIYKYLPPLTSTIYY